MTAALGRLPSIEAGAWVWNDVQPGLSGPLTVRGDTLAVVRREVRGRLRAGSWSAWRCRTASSDAAGDARDGRQALKGVPGSADSE